MARAMASSRDALVCLWISAALVLVNAHGGDYVLGNVAQEAGIQGRAMALFPTREDWQDARTTAGDRSSLLTEGMRASTRSGVIGRPSLVTADKGKAGKGKAVLHSPTSGFADVMDMLTKL